MEIEEESQEQEISEQDEDSEEAPDLVPAAATHKPLIDEADTTKQIRSILNKVSEGNIEPMFKQLMEVVQSLYNKDKQTFTNCYAGIFKQLTYNLD